MLDAIEFTSFKCFREQKIGLKPLTLLSGVNGMGKSSVIQGLALLRQSANERLLPDEGLLLNGSWVSLGTAQDVLYEFAEADEIHIGLKTKRGPARWRFSARNPEDDLLKKLKGPTLLPDIPLFRPGALYLSAERLGPRALHPMSNFEVRTRGEIRADGSLAVAWLDENARLSVEPQVCHNTMPTQSLPEQLEAWMSEITPGVRVNTSVRRHLQAIELGFGFALAGATTRSMRPTGVGFGLSYTLPVVLVCLAAGPERLIMLENPEAHLHPRAQMAIGDLIARAAATGAQLIVETHSDHLLNGVRLAVKQGRLSPNHVAIHFFSRHVEKHRLVHDVVSPRIDADGRLDTWPEGFFDQFDVALEQLM